MAIFLAALFSGLIGALGPMVLRRLPEPLEPATDKVAYAVLATPRPLAPGLAFFAAALGGTVAWKIEHLELLPAWILICGVGVWLSYIDWRTRLLPYFIVGPLYAATFALVGLGALMMRDGSVFIRAVLTNIVVYLVYRLLYWLGARFFGGALGYGDVRLAGVLGLALGALGPSHTTAGLYSSFLLGGVLGLALSIFKLVDRKGFAFGPYMIVGAIIGVIWGAASVS